MKAVIEVELVNSGGFPLGEAVIAIAAVAAAALAAWTADRRLKKTLAAEHVRHRAELDHDRSMRDLDELRKTFDDASSRFASLKRTGSDLVTLGVAHADEADVDEVIEPLREQFSAEAGEIRDRYERMALRLGINDPLTVCVDLIHRTCQEFLRRSARAIGLPGKTCRWSWRAPWPPVATTPGYSAATLASGSQATSRARAISTTSAASSAGV